MNRSLLILLITAALALTGYQTYYRCATATARTMCAQSDGGMEWLRREYHLTDAQFARVQRVHQEYAPQCDRMCEKIGQANARLDRTIHDHQTYAPEVATAMQECIAVQGECRQALLAHIYAVSAEMPPADGARYVEMMKSRIVEPQVSHAAVISQSAK